MPEQLPEIHSGLFAWYGQRSYFRPHWQELLSARGIDDINLDPVFKDRNSDLLTSATADWSQDSPNLLLMTIGEIPLTLEGFRLLPSATKVAYMTDDEWRFHSVGRYLSLYFDVVVTNTEPRIKDYKSHGVNNVIHYPYAANTSVFKPVEGSKIHDVVMIGAAHPDRMELARHLVSNKIPFRVYGSGWDRYPEFSKIWGGFLSTAEMLNVIATSKIVVNPGLTIGGLPQIKGRIFETAACRTFQITQQLPNLDRYYIPGKEVETYSDLEELTLKIDRFLSDESSRESIASAGYERTIRDHSWETRIRGILEEARTVLVREQRDTQVPVIQITPNSDHRAVIENAVENDVAAVITFTQGTGVDDPDRIKLLEFGLRHDMTENIWLNLATFDVVDSKCRVVANAAVDTMANVAPDLLPPRSAMLSAGKCLELLPEGEITQDRIFSEVVPILIGKGQYRHIDLDTGLFQELASGNYSISEIYRRSDEGIWDVRTRPYGSALIKSLAIFDGSKLGLAILRRRRMRRTAVR